jgi:hypothetical protein
VDHDELLRRLDGHVERGNAIMARSNELVEENHRVIQENHRVIQENTRAFEDLRSFLGDLTLALRLLTEDFRAEMRAQREALFRILDRLDGQGEGSSGA